MPETWPIIAAVIMGLIEDGRLDMGLWVLIGFGLYLRPSENMQLRREDLIPPSPPTSPWWTFNLCPESRGLSSKTGSSDDTVLWDSQELSWAAPAFPHLVRNARNDGRIWGFSYPDLVKAVTKVAKRLGIDFVPCQLRHSGPSWERLRRERSLLGIQKRGRWRTFRSVTRYEKAGRMLQRYRQLPQSLRSHAEACAENLRAVVLGEQLATRASEPLCSSTSSQALEV